MGGQQEVKKNMDVTDKIYSEIQQNRMKQRKFVEYLNRSKKVGRDGAPKQLVIDE